MALASVEFWAAQSRSSCRSALLRDRRSGWWLCKRKATRLCQTCSKVAALPDLQPVAIAANYQSALTGFQDPAFQMSDSLLSDVAGKKILASLSRHLHSLHAPGALNRRLLANRLLGILDQIYTPNAIFQPDDFAELAGILRQYSTYPSITLTCALRRNAIRTFCPPTTLMVCV